jgi:hypothetical protein
VASGSNHYALGVFSSSGAPGSEVAKAAPVKSSAADLQLCLLHNKPMSSGLAGVGFEPQVVISNIYVYVYVHCARVRVYVYVCICGSEYVMYGFVFARVWGL